MAIADRSGLPVAIGIASASPHEVMASFTSHKGQLTSLGVLGRVWVFPRGFTEPAKRSPATLVVTPDEVYFEE